MNPISMMGKGMPLYSLRMNPGSGSTSNRRLQMHKHKVVWTETHTVEVEASNLSDAKKSVNEMKFQDLLQDPTYTVEISGLPRDTSKK